MQDAGKPEGLWLKQDGDGGGSTPFPLHSAGDPTSSPGGEVVGKTAALLTGPVQVVRGLIGRFRDLIRRGEDPGAWIFGTRTIGRISAVRAAEPVRFEGIEGSHRRDAYLDSTWELLE